MRPVDFGRSPYIQIVPSWPRLWLHLVGSVLKDYHSESRLLQKNFQSLMSNLLKNREGCEAIMDDIIVYGKSAEEHDENLQNTFEVI